MKKNIVIVPACTDLNRGDQALVWESAYLLNDALNGEVSIKIVDYGNNAEDRMRQSSQTKETGFCVIRNITENPKRYINNGTVHNKFTAFISAGFVAMLDFIRHFILLIMPLDSVFSWLYRDSDYKHTFESIKNSDALVIKGGGYLHTYGKVEDLYYLWFGLYYVLLAKRLGKKVIIFPNSIGPITGLLNRAFFKYVIKKVDLVFVREKISQSYLKSMGIENSIYAFDLGYYSKFTPVEKSKKQIVDNDSKLKVGITLRPYRFPQSINPEEKYNSYINSIVDFCISNSFDYRFYFIVQVQGPSAHETDLIAINDVIGKLPDTVHCEVIDDSYNYRELLDIYSSMDYVIGTRFHSVIFSQIMDVPSLAIAYGGNKSRGIMRELDLEKYVIDIEEVSGESLSTMMNELLMGREEYIEKLKLNRMKIDIDRDNVINEVRKILK